MPDVTTAPLRFRRRPLEVAAVHWTGENGDELSALLGACFNPTLAAVYTNAERGWMFLEPGVWVALSPFGAMVLTEAELAATFEAVPPEDGASA